MMPNVAGIRSTRRQILIYSALLAPLGVAPYFIGLGGVAYLATSAVLGAVFVWYAWQLYTTAEEEGREADTAARRLFGFSILYLFALFLVLLAEQTVRFAMAA
jgi:heme o synthase